MTALFIFVRSGVQFGVPVVRVLEIVEAPALLPAHDAMPGCLGNVSHRGYLLPVLDPAALGNGRAAVSSGRFVVVSADESVFGLALDGFVSVAALDGDDESRCNPDERNPYVEKARVYRDNALVLLSVGSIDRLVRTHFAQQRFSARTQGLAAPQPSDNGLGAEIFLCVRIDDVPLAIPIEHVMEIVEGNDLTPLFRVPALIRGLINLRGQVLACLDISADLGLPPRSIGERNQFVVLRCEDAELALCVDKVTGIRRLPVGQFQKPKMVLAGELSRLASSMHEGEDGTLLILAVAGVFNAPALLPFRGVEA